MTDQGKILAVDDTPASLRLLTDILQAEGYEVRSAISGELALRAATSNPPDLVLLDIRMPGMDGYEVCRRLKANPVTRDVPVIFVSAISETDEKVKGFGIGAVDFVTKPYQRDELMARVRTHLELNRLRHHLEDLVAERTAELRKSESLLKTVIDTAPMRIFWKDKELRYLGCNPAFARDAGEAGPEDLLGKDDYQLGWREQAELYRADDRRVMESGIPKHSYDEPQTTSDGKTIWLRTSKVPLIDNTNETIGVLGIYEDVTERKTAQVSIERLTNLYRALSEVNQAIVRMDDESALFPLVCRMAVDFGGARMAWIGRLNQANGLIEPVASYGSGAEYLNSIVVSSKQDVPEGRGLVGIAFRENRNVIVNNFQTSEMTKPWHESALRYDLRSCGSFPIPRAGEPFAVFTVYHSQPDAFDAEMIRLLDEMSHDISFALDNFDRERARRQSREEALRNSERLTALIEAIPDTVFLKDGEGRWLITNEPAKQMFQLHSLPWQGKTEMELADLHPAFRAAHEGCLVGDEKAWQAGHLLVDEEIVVGEDGRSATIETRKVPLFSTEGQRKGLVVIGRDITERKRAELELRLAATAFETQEGILITDRDERILRVNRAFTRLTGYGAEEAIGQTPAMLHSGQQDAEFYRSLWETVNRDHYWQGEIWNRRKDGVVYPEWLTITSVTDADGLVTHYVAVFSDLTLRKAADEKIHQLAFYDPLTRLPNRSLLVDRLRQAQASRVHSGQHGALLFLNLDHFKILNDTRGHEIGDLLLIEVARRLQSCVREGDSVACLGGDEFAVILKTLSVIADEAAVQAELVAEKIHVALNHPYQLKEHIHHSTSSIGISLFRDRVESVEDLFKHADIAMYQAKSVGRNAIRFYDPAIQAALEMRSELESELRQALEKQQFRLYYQIQVDSQQRPLGAEALLRWEHHERGLISPMQFIPLAEDTGLIVPIGLWVLQTACAQLNTWQHDALGRDLILAVNVSAKQFRQPDFVAQVQRVLMESGATPSHLKLELTESIVLEDVEGVISKMHELKRLGVSFSMDDFGTGYSSLQYLKRLPLDQIKIDQSFVRDITSDPNGAAMVQAIIAMADALGLNVIAEGVETEAQRDFLERHGCNTFQGYLFAKPVPIEAFEALLGTPL